MRARAVRGLADELGGRLRRDASDAELAANPRARSAVMRVAEKLK